MVAPPKSSDPNKTSGRFAQSQTSLSYPVHETLDIGTRLKFMRYSRFMPNSEPQLQTTAIISLPIPLGVPDVTSIRTTSPVDLGLAGNIDPRKIVGAVQSSDGSAETIAKLWKEGQSAMMGFMKDAQGSAENSLRALAISPGIVDAVLPGNVTQKLQRFIGTIQNPHTTTFFEGMNLRPYSFAWRFSPKSAQESQALRNIINTIKIRTHPEETLSGFALDYPDLVQVEFTGNIKDHLPKYYQSFVTNVTTNIGSGNGMQFYSDGAPVELELNISFIEISIITRQVLETEINGTS